jgi:hypothetical protein
MHRLAFRSASFSFFFGYGGCNVDQRKSLRPHHAHRFWLGNGDRGNDWLHWHVGMDWLGTVDNGSSWRLPVIQDIWPVVVSDSENGLRQGIECARYKINSKIIKRATCQEWSGSTAPRGYISVLRVCNTLWKGHPDLLQFILTVSIRKICAHRSTFTHEIKFHTLGLF